MLYRVSYRNIPFPPVAIDAQTPKDAATIFCFKHPDRRGREVHVVGDDGSDNVFSTDDVIPDVTSQTSPDAFVVTLSKRYREAYTEAHAVVAVGKLIKRVGIFLGVALLLAGFAIGDRSGSAQATIFALVAACVVGVPIFILGILVAAQGQSQLAILDTAVNTSRHLSNDDIAAILSKRFSL
jgi:hypothetical protein